MTLNMSLSSFGVGSLTISEVSDSYVKGTFNFVADWSGEDTLNKRFEVTDGQFKAKVGRSF